MAMSGRAEWRKTVAARFLEAEWQRVFAVSVQVALHDRPHILVATRETMLLAAQPQAQGRTPANGGQPAEDCDFDSAPSCLIRYAHRESISDDVEFGPTKKKLIHPQRNIAGMVTGGLYDRAFG
jgi:hypothetical protein